MDHRWDESRWQDRAARGERQTYESARVQRDPDVERRDRLREAERRATPQSSAWEIGDRYHDQRDLFTRNARIDEEGYGYGPSYHPEEGSYASAHRRAQTHAAQRPSPSDATLYEREAWPWLNYKRTDEDPYFRHLHPQEGDGVWDRIKEGALSLKDRITGHPHVGKGPKNWQRSDDRIREDVSDALAIRGDLDASDIEVTVKNAEVTLEGTVGDRRSKRVAEEVCEGIRGVRDVHNRLTIRHDDPTDANVAFVLPLAMMGAL